MKNTFSEYKLSAVSVLAKVCVLLFVGILFYIFSIYTPLFADDYSYTYSFATGERIKSIADIVESQIAHYGSTNGRFVTHFFAQLFLLMGKPVFNYINVVIFLLLGVLVCFHATGSFRCITTSELIIAYAILFLSAPAFGQSFLWLDGSATYSFGVVIALIYMIPFRTMIHKVQHGIYTQGSVLSQVFKFAWTFVLGVLAGNTSENVGSCVIIFVLLCGIYAKLHKVKVQLWMLGLGNITGTVLAVISPGTQSRMASTGGLAIIGMVKNVVFIGANFVKYLQLPLCIFAGLLIGYLMCSKSTTIKEHFENQSILVIYCVSLLAAAFSMILSTQFPERAWSIVVVLSAVVVILGFHTLMGAVPKMPRIRTAIAVLLVVLSFGPYVNEYLRIKAMYVFHQTRVDAIVYAVQSGERSVAISAIASSSPYSVFDPLGDLNWDSTKWPNTAIARYYGIEEVKRAPEDFDY